MISIKYEGSRLLLRLQALWSEHQQLEVTENLLKMQNVKLCPRPTDFWTCLLRGCLGWFIGTLMSVKRWPSHWVSECSGNARFFPPHYSRCTNNPVQLELIDCPHHFLLLVSAQQIPFSLLHRGKGSIRKQMHGLETRLPQKVKSEDFCLCSFTLLQAGSWQQSFYSLF